MTALTRPAALRSVATMFAANGLIIGTYAASLPLLRDRLRLSAVQLPLILLVVGLFGIIGMQICGRLVDRHGARPVVVIALLILSAGAGVIAVAPLFPLALLGAVLLGLGNGGIDVAMNAFGVQIEQARTTAIMSRLHAVWSLGNFAGAGIVLLGSLVAGAKGALGLASMLGVVAAVALRRWCPHVRPGGEPGPQQPAPGAGRIPPVAWLLGLMAVGFGLAEGTAYDWSSVHVTDVTGVDPGLGALGLAVTAGFMVLIRLLGDGLVDRRGRRAVIRFGGVCAAVGYALTVFATGLPFVLTGWALIGLGVGMIAPQVYAVAGHLGGGRVLSVVVTFGYATFLAGPAVVGGLVAAWGIQRAMLVPGAMCLALVLMSVGMPRD